MAAETKLVAPRLSNSRRGSGHFGFCFALRGEKYRLAASSVLAFFFERYSHACFVPAPLRTHLELAAFGV
jgi:hypothetical protein